MLNVIWSGFFVVSFAAAVYQTLILGQTHIWSDMVNASFSAARTAFEVSLNLTGMMCLWLGLLKIAEKSGLTALLARGLRPLFKKIMPEVPADSPALGSVIMNMAANMLGLDNAATPIGIRAMEQLQELNPHKDKASPAQILFMVINTSAVTLLPISILLYRQQFGAVNPAAVFVPILLATSVSTLVGFFSVAAAEKLPVFNGVVLAYLAVFAAFAAGTAVWFGSLEQAERIVAAETVGNFVLFAVMSGFIISGLIKRLNVYDVFIDGAKEGFATAVKIIPYMVSMLVGIAVFRASGVLEYLLAGIEYMLTGLNCDSSFLQALPTALLKPLSGSGARAMMIETMQTYGVDSFPAFVSAVVQGSTETTFYVLAVYFGAVRIAKTGAALPCALLADLGGIVAAVYLGYLFY